MSETVERAEPAAGAAAGPAAGEQLHHPLAVAFRNTVLRLIPIRVSSRWMARIVDWRPPDPTKGA